MKLLMTLLVCNEEDIISLHIEYHLKQGVDYFIITDCGSEDRTVQILEDFQRRGIVHVIREDGNGSKPFEHHSRMAGLAYSDFGADWVIHSNSDGFLWPNDGRGFKNTLAKIPGSVFSVRPVLFNFVPVENSEQESFLNSMVWRETKPLSDSESDHIPGFIHRGGEQVDISSGFQVIKDRVQLAFGAVDLEIFNYPVRSYKQIASKVAGSRFLDPDGKNASKWGALYSTYLKNQLPAYFQEEVFCSQKIETSVLDGELVEDCRLKIFFDKYLPPKRPKWYQFFRKPSDSYPIVQQRAPQGIVTLADKNYFPGLILLNHSVQSNYPVPILCFDLGLDREQLNWAEQNMKNVIIRKIPERPIIREIETLAGAGNMKKAGKREWPLWICPYLIAEAPFKQVFWLDCDIAVLRNLKQLFDFLDDGPVFTPENNAPHLTPNKPELYDLLPIDREFDPLVPTLNGGVSGWDLDRDGGALEAYGYPVRQAFLGNQDIQKAISWHDQGALIWAVQNAGLENRVLKSTSWNLCVKHTAAFQKMYPFSPPFEWAPDILDRLREDAKQANLLHWNGARLPWAL